MKLRLWLMGLLLVTSNAFAQDMITKVIQLNYVPASKVIQLIQPMMNSGERISGTGQTLVVNVSPDTLTMIRDVLHKIDVPPVTFNISVFQGDPNWLSSQNNNDVIYSTNPQWQVQRSQSVRVLSGESAFVSTAQQIPIVSAVGVGFFTGVDYQQHNIENGILILPVLQGSQVKLSVKRVRQQQNVAGGQQFDNQQINTTVMAPLNKWVSLGSAEGAQNNTSSSSTSFTAGRPFSQNSTLYIKVSVVNAVPSGQSK
ncbi:secretin N-terminal domain-containing protein [Legionella shakespearei]|uniref:Type II/III secretion system protein n=1 Tax=Legionella shakespearei DSM 23087 TaxID=1122169 RepID=A0A0W0YHQ6_9GAMM|nr:secretin N-terminal domain-containing protein [Legionella shakespearei]KTD56489.1 type II/III secretion system protein [Legionella shakespearei DSM 23087]